VDELRPQDNGQAEGIVKMSDPKVFYYETEIEWTKEKEGQIGGPSLPAVPVGAPPEFKGREGTWSPEHLFVASLNTLHAYLSPSRKIPR
jgi:organic hydroperoxide reductase OsmC/OhrA